MALPSWTRELVALLVGAPVKAKPVVLAEPVIRPEKEGLLTTFRVVELPRATLPPPLRLVPGLTVSELLTKSVLVTLPAPMVVAPLPLMVTSPLTDWLTKALPLYWRIWPLLAVPRVRVVPWSL